MSWQTSKTDLLLIFFFFSCFFSVFLFVVEIFFSLDYMYRCLLMKQVLAELSECFICWFCNDIFVCKCIMSNHDKQRRRPSLVLQGQQQHNHSTTTAKISTELMPFMHFRILSMMFASFDQLLYIYCGVFRRFHCACVCNIRCTIDNDRK